MLPLHCLHFLFIFSGLRNRGLTEQSPAGADIFKEASPQQKQIKKRTKSLKEEKRLVLVHWPVYLVQVLLLGQFTAPLH